MLSGTLSSGGGGGGGRELDFRGKSSRMQKDGEFLLDGCPIPGNNPNHPRTKLISRVFAFFLYLITLAIVGAMTVLVIMAKPIITHNGYQPTTCRVNLTRFYGEQECRCGIGCRSKMPCGQVFIDFPLVHNKSGNVTWVYGRLLHEDQLNEKHYPICSISSNARCYKQDDYNVIDVQKFLSHFNDTKNEEESFQCFYNRNNPDSVLLYIVPSTRFIQIILAASWGLVGIIIILLTLLGLILTACNRCVDVPEPEPEDLPLASEPGTDDSGWINPVDVKDSGGVADDDAIPEAVVVDSNKNAS